MDRKKMYKEYFNTKEVPEPYHIEGMEKIFHIKENNINKPTISIENVSKKIQDPIQEAIKIYQKEGLHALSDIKVTFHEIKKRRVFKEEKTSCRAMRTPNKGHQVYIYTGSDKTRPSIQEISLEGQTAIIAHELMHLRTYKNRSRKDKITIIKTYLTMFMKKQLNQSDAGRALVTIEKYEKRIDEQVIMLGMGKGLMEYQNHIAPLLNEIETRKREYMYRTNKEIQEKIDTQEESMNSATPSSPPQ